MGHFITDAATIVHLEFAPVRCQHKATCNNFDSCHRGDGLDRPTWSTMVDGHGVSVICVDFDPLHDKHRTGPVIDHLRKNGQPPRRVDRDQPRGKDTDNHDRSETGPEDPANRGSFVHAINW